MRPQIARWSMGSAMRAERPTVPGRTKIGLAARARARRHRGSWRSSRAPAGEPKQRARR